ncbi:hypothetical protein GCM10028812_50790 [Ancylobacter sonchi]
MGHGIEESREREERHLVGGLNASAPAQMGRQESFLHGIELETSCDRAASCREPLQVPPYPIGLHQRVGIRGQKGALIAGMLQPQTGEVQCKASREAGIGPIGRQANVMHTMRNAGASELLARARYGCVATIIGKQDDAERGPTVRGGLRGLSEKSCQAGFYAIAFISRRECNDRPWRCSIPRLPLMQANGNIKS